MTYASVCWLQTSSRWVARCTQHMPYLQSKRSLKCYHWELNVPAIGDCVGRPPLLHVVIYGFAPSGCLAGHCAQTSTPTCAFRCCSLWCGHLTVQITVFFIWWINVFWALATMTEACFGGGPVLREVRAHTHTHTHTHTHRARACLCVCVCVGEPGHVDWHWISLWSSQPDISKLLILQKALVWKETSWWGVSQVYLVWYKKYNKHNCNSKPPLFYHLPSQYRRCWQSLSWLSIHCSQQ